VVDKAQSPGADIRPHNMLTSSDHLSKRPHPTRRDEGSTASPPRVSASTGSVRSSAAASVQTPFPGEATAPVHIGTRARVAVGQPTVRRPAMGRVQKGALDSVSVVFLALLFVGLVSIVLAVWMVYSLILTRGDASGGGYDFERRALEAEQARDALQQEIVVLGGELEEARQALATVSAQTTPDAPNTGHGWSTVDRPPLGLVLDAPIYKQQRSLSCESSAASMAANYFGVSISEQDVLSALPRHENPHLGFRGNVDGSYGGIDDYGVYAEPIRQVLVGLGLQVEHLGGDTDTIREHIRRGRLVIAWITYNMQVQSPQQVTLGDGQTVTLVPYEHTVLVVGYNRSGLWINDPYSGTQTFYPEGDFVRSFAYLGNMALVVGPPAGQ
jgi:uncharacterized protein YvpB